MTPDPNDEPQPAAQPAPPAMLLSADQLAASTGATLAAARIWLAPFEASMSLFAITRPLRMAAFLAQIGHESGHLRYVREIWGPTDAQKGYEGRKDLGNTQPGDGRRYMGRGLIQVTGRANYRVMRDELGRLLRGVPDFELYPERMELPNWAAYSAGCFWMTKRLNLLADNSLFEQITKRVNGGLTGQAERLVLYRAALDAFGITGGP